MLYLFEHELALLGLSILHECDLAPLVLRLAKLIVRQFLPLTCEIDDAKFTYGIVMYMTLATCRHLRQAQLDRYVVLRLTRRAKRLVDPLTSNLKEK